MPSSASVVRTSLIAYYYLNGYRWLMPSYIDPRFRPTLWPGTVVPTPPLRPFADAQVEGDWIVWPPGTSWESAPVQLPADFYLRELMELQADDLEAAVGLYRSYGNLFDFDREELNLKSYDDDYMAKVDAIPDGPEGMRGGVHRDLVKLHIETAQRAIRTWLACQREGGLEELVAQDVTKEHLAEIREASGHDVADSLDKFEELLIGVRLSDLETVVNAALGKFSIGIRELAHRWPTIYSVSFLQLYNHMVEGAVAHRCASETCQRLFVRQRGRAEYGQYRTEGVKYCSRECARAQAQRELRRRRKAR